MQLGFFPSAPDRTQLAVEGHGKTTYKVGMIRDIALSLNAEAMKSPPSKHAVLKIRYSYSDSAIPAGGQERLNSWRLIGVLAEPDQADPGKSE